MNSHFLAMAMLLNGFQMKYLSSSRFCLTRQTRFPFPVREIL